MAASSMKTDRAKISAWSRHRPADDPQLLAARRDFRAERLAEHIARVVAEAPPLSQAQLDRLAVLLRPSSESAG